VFTRSKGATPKVRTPSPAIALWNTEEIFHLADCEVRHAPGPNFACRAQAFKPNRYLREISVRTWPVQQIEIEVISAETGEARLASVRHAVSGYITGRQFGDQKYAVALIGNHVAN
jgi:hypothetical protein